ncbi:MULTISPECIES: hypothetical protein [unclassified Sutcliffiella]|uniref:hypothetical protein n=1 Tax=unclassified Sutcliffiella TaxID=2837532 RepID=UPI0030D4E7C7
MISRLGIATDLIESATEIKSVTDLSASIVNPLSNLTDKLPIAKLSIFEEEITTAMDKIEVKVKPIDLGRKRFSLGT